MKHPYRKIAYLFLLTATLAVTGIHGYYLAREGIAKWAFAHRSYFTADELIRIAIPQADLTSRDAYLLDEGEFNWQGQMVDVLYREVRSDTLYIYGFRDEAETELSKQAAWLYRDTDHTDHQPTNSRSHTKRFKWFSPFVLPPPGELTPAVGFILLIRQSIFVYSLPRARLPLLDVLSPPPNF